MPLDRAVLPLGMNKFAPFRQHAIQYAQCHNPLSQSKKENERKISVNNEGVVLQFHFH